MSEVQVSRQAARPRVRARRMIIAGFVLAILVLGGVLGISGYVGWNLTHPVRQAVNETPRSLGLSYQDVAFKSRVDRLNLKGWLIRSPGSRNTVIFAHGYRKNRLNNDVPILPIAKTLVKSGYNVLMFDFRNCGESEGKLTSVGQFEVRDLLGAVDYIGAQKDLNGNIVLYGFSMGASTAIMAGSRDSEVAAVIADSPFADLRSYLRENLSVWSNLPAFPFNQAFFIVVPPLTGLKPDTVSPVKEIAAMQGRPLLLIHGTADKDVPIRNSEVLKKAYPQAQLFKVTGGTHVKNYAAAPDLYLNTVLDFLDKLPNK